MTVQPRDFNAIQQERHPGGIERRGAEPSIALDESTVVSFFDIVGRLSDDPFAVAALLGPDDPQGWVVTPPHEANVRLPAAPRASIRRVRDGSSLTGRNDSGAPSDEAGAVAAASCPRRILRNKLLARSARRSETVPDWRRPTGKCIKEDLAPLQDLNKDSVIIIITSDAG
jgi:hypothetical protein